MRIGLLYFLLVLILSPVCAVAQTPPASGGSDVKPISEWRIGLKLEVAHPPVNSAALEGSPAWELNIRGSSHRVQIVTIDERLDDENLAWRMSVYTLPGLPEDAGNELGRQIAEQVQRIATSDRDLSPQQRIDRIVECNRELNQVDRKLMVVTELHSMMPSRAKQAGAEYQELKNRFEQLEMKRAELEARQQALQLGIARQRDRAQIQHQADAVSEQLRKIVELSEADLKHLQQLHAAASVSQTEVNKAEAALAEAKLRLAEREARLSKSGSGELLDRLAEELAMVSVDLTEVEIQYEHVNEQLRRRDPARMNEKDLDRLIGGSTEQDGKPRQTLYEELSRRKAELQRELFALRVENVEYVPDPAPTSGGGAADRQAAPSPEAPTAPEP